MCREWVRHSPREHSRLLLSHLKSVWGREREISVDRSAARWRGKKKVRIEGRRHSATSEIANKRPFHQPWALQQIKVLRVKQGDRLGVHCAAGGGCRRWCERSHQGWMGEKRSPAGANEKGRNGAAAAAAASHPAGKKRHCRKGAESTSKLHPCSYSARQSFTMTACHQLYN